MPLLKKDDSHKAPEPKQLSHFAAYEIVEKKEYIEILKQDLLKDILLEKDSQCLFYDIIQNFAEFSSNILIINIGIKNDADGVFMLDINKSEIDIDKYAISSLIHLLNAIIINFLLNIKIHRERYIIEFNGAISEINISNNNYIDGMIDVLKILIEGYNSSAHCTEIGVFERFANRIDIKAINYGNSLFKEKYVFNKFSNQPLTIGARKTLIDSVASKKMPYYVESVDNPTHNLYERVIEATKSQLTIPLIYQNKVLGVLNIGVDIEGGFLPYDRKLLINLSHIIALILNQRKMFISQKIITERFINKIILIKTDKDLKSEIDKLTTQTEIVQNTFYEYMKLLHKEFVNYNLMLIRPRSVINSVKNVIASAIHDIKSIYTDYISKEFKINNTIELEFELAIEETCPESIEFYDDILHQAMISIYIFSIDNCIRLLKTNKKNETKFKISTYVKRKNSDLIIEIIDNGEFPQSKYLNEIFTDIDYPKPIEIVDGNVKKYCGIPFYIIDYLFQENCELNIYSNKKTNSVELHIQI